MVHPFVIYLNEDDGDISIHYNPNLNQLKYVMELTTVGTGEGSYDIKYFNVERKKHLSELCVLNLLNSLNKVI